MNENERTNRIRQFQKLTVWKKKIIKLKQKNLTIKILYN